MGAGGLPILYDWTDEGVMRPQPRFARACDKQFVVGETYRLEVIEERSRQTHNHYFAALHEAWMNLPEDIADEYPTDEHLRKKLLVKAGYADERSIVCASKAEALRIAAFIRPMDEYAIVVVRENVVKAFTAQSQSKRAMGAKAFQESKQAVLDLACGLLGVSLRDLGDQMRDRPKRERKTA